MVVQIMRLYILMGQNDLNSALLTESKGNPIKNGIMPISSREWRDHGPTTMNGHYGGAILL